MPPSDASDPTGDTTVPPSDGSGSEPVPPTPAPARVSAFGGGQHAAPRVPGAPPSPEPPADPAAAASAPAAPSAAADGDGSADAIVPGVPPSAATDRRATPDTAPLEPAAPVPPDPLPVRDRLLRRLLGQRTLLLDATPRARLIGWLWPLAVTVLAGVARFWDLGRPHALVFDETYYVKDAYSLLVHGYEAQWTSDPNPAFEAGDVSGLGTAAEYVVHPQVGKWLIALGIQLGGGVDSSAAWRLSVAVAGTLCVLLVARIGRRLFASTALGTLAGLLLAVDGEALVMSRTSLLDPFLTLFALAAFGALLLDRDQARRRLADRTAALLEAGRDLRWGPGLGWRWWRLVAAALLGLATGTKWSGLYFLAVFGLLSVAWDATARRTIGVRHWLVAGIVRDGIVAGVVMTVAAGAVYVGSWWSWFVHPGAYGRQWAVEHPGEGVTWLPPALRSLWKYHLDMWHFHNNLDSPHDYAAHPLGWIVQWRPTSFYYPKSVSGLTGQAAYDACGAPSCSQAITSIGNPVLWWCAAAAVVVAVVVLLRARDWRAGAVLSGIAAGWLPWFAYAHRTIFTFYSVAFTPWMVLTLTYVLGLVVRGGTAEPVDGQDEDAWAARDRRWAAGVVGALVALIVAVSVFFYPIWTAWVVPYQFWHLHMWLPSWI